MLFSSPKSRRRFRERRSEKSLFRRSETAQRRRRERSHFYPRMHGTAFERVVDGGIQPRVESDDLRTDPFLDKMLDLIF